MVNPVVETLGDRRAVANSARRSYSAMNLATQLRHSGVEVESLPDRDLVLQPEIGDPVGYYPRLTKKLVLDIVTRLEDDCLNVVGFTNYHETAISSFSIASRVRTVAEELGKKVMLIAGGPYIVKEKPVLVKNEKPFPDSLTALLKGELPDRDLVAYDGAVQGGPGALVQLLQMVERDGFRKVNGLYVPDETPDGYFHLKEDEFIGQGKSKDLARQLDYAPFAYHDGALSFMMKNNCGNGCGFCNIGGRFRYSVEQVVEGIKHFKRQHPDEKVRQLVVKDPNPLSQANYNHTVKCFEAIEMELGYKVPKVLNIDSDLFSSSNSLGLDDIKRLDIIRIFIGKDAVTESGAEFLRTRDSTQVIKTEQALADEAIGIASLIYQARENGYPLIINVSYIVSPNDTPTSYVKLLSDAASMQNLSQECVLVDPQFGFVFPLPGSEVIQEYTDLLVDRPYLTLGALNQWDTEAVLRGFPDSAISMFNSSQPALSHSCRYDLSEL